MFGRFLMYFVSAQDNEDSDETVFLIDSEEPSLSALPILLGSTQLRLTKNWSPQMEGKNQPLFSEKNGVA